MGFPTIVVGIVCYRQGIPPGFYYISYGMVLCVARQGIHINRKDQQARFIAL
jgi:hypothetical protein